MKTIELSKIVTVAPAAALISLLLVAGCSSSDAKAPPASPAPAEQAATPPAVETAAAPAPEAKAEARPAAEDLERSQLAAGAPFVVTLSGPGTPPESGQIDLTMVIDVPSPLKSPAQIAVILPKNTTLVSGAAQESLPELAAGKLTRTYKVKVEGKLVEPVRVVVESKDPAGKMGARSEQTYPERAATPYKRPYSDGKVPPPPGGRPGARK